MNFSFLPKMNIFLFCCLCLMGCSKSGSKTTNAELIASSNWKFSKAGIDQDNNGTIDVDAPASLVQACLTDNIVTFKSDKSGVVDEGATKCSASDPQTSTFTWSLSADEKTITFSGPIIAGVGGDAKIIELTESRFVLSKSLAITGVPTAVPIVVILVH